jgi:hypothetical protein
MAAYGGAAAKRRQTTSMGRSGERWPTNPESAAPERASADSATTTPNSAPSVVIQLAYTGLITSMPAASIVLVTTTSSTRLRITAVPERNRRPLTRSPQ